ncbi:MAG TPA: low temperature requirement protein A [Acidimicrobiia bacterium]|nr:low temperature requirement protein A [Acidimicrobiia bacterium]
MATRPGLRRLWRPPGRFEDRDPDRRVTFLELFFDLVFVAVIAQLAHHLAEHISWASIGWFVFLFYAVWSSWINGTLYHDLHGTNDLSIRVFTFAQMLAVALMAVHAGAVPGEGSDGFAIGYALNTLVLVVLWFRTGLHDPHHRAASVPYSIAYLLSAALFAASVFVEQPLSYWMWGVALLVELGGFAVAMYRFTPPDSQGGEATIATTPSLIERMGLFVIIVLGEVVVGSVNGMADLTPLDLDETVIGLCGVLVAIGLWWLYFDLVSHRAPLSRFTQLWLYLHLPMVIAIAAGGAGVLTTIEHAASPLPGEVRWLLVGSLAIAVLSIVGLTLILEIRSHHDAVAVVYRVADRASLISAALILLVGLTTWGTKATLIGMVVLLLYPVWAALRVWARLGEFDQAAG